MEKNQGNNQPSPSRTKEVIRRNTSGDGREKPLVSRCSFEQKWVCSTAPTRPFILGTGCRAQEPYGGANIGHLQPGLPLPSPPTQAATCFLMEKGNFFQTVQLQSTKSLLQDGKLCRNRFKLPFYSCRLVQQSQRHLISVLFCMPLRFPNIFLMYEIHSCVFK